MSITLATGTQAAIASAYGASFDVTAATNAAEAVLTLEAGHGLVVGDFFELTSGWDLATGKILRAKTVVANEVTADALNTSSLDNYPAGAGVGSIRKINAWTPITQLQIIGTSGGDQNFADITTIADRIQKQIPTTRSAQEISLTVFDDPSLTWYAPVVAASDSATPAGLRFIFPNGSRLVANGYWSIQKTPNVAANQPLTAGITFSALAEPVRYAN